MAGYVFHYTSRLGAQSIAIAGRIAPGRGGRVYLTQDAYQTGAAAANLLSLTSSRPVEDVCVVSEGALADASEPRVVEPLLRADGSEERQGGGSEIWVTNDVDVQCIWELEHP